MFVHVEKFNMDGSSFWGQGGDVRGRVHVLRH